MITKIKNNSITLPKTWQKANVFLRITDNTATITKIPKSKTIFNQTEIKSLRKLGKKITRSIIARALSAN